MDFEQLTPEQKERVRNVKTPEEMLALAQEEGYELSDAELEDISGGIEWGCPRHGSDCTSLCDTYAR